MIQAFCRAAAVTLGLLLVVAAAPASAEELIGTWLTPAGRRPHPRGEMRQGHVRNRGVAPGCGRSPRPASRRWTTRTPIRAMRSRKILGIRIFAMEQDSNRRLDRRHLQLRRRPDLQGPAGAARRRRARSAGLRRLAVRLRGLDQGRSNVSEQEIPLRHRQHLGRRAGEQLAVGAHLVGFRIDLDVGRGAVVHHALLGDVAGVLDRDELLLDAELVAQARS